MLIMVGEPKLLRGQRTDISVLVIDGKGLTHQ